MDYQFFQHLNNEPRFIGLTYDVVIPAGIGGALIFFLLMSPLLAGTFVFSWYLLIRKLRAGRSFAYFYEYLHQFPSLKTRVQSDIFEKSWVGAIPPAQKVYWLG